MTPLLLLLPLQGWAPFAEVPDLLEQAALTESQTQLLEAIASATERVAPLGLPASTRQCFEDPWGTPARAVQRTDRMLRHGRRGSWDRVLEEAADVLGLSSPLRVEGTQPDIDPFVHLPYLHALVTGAVGDEETRAARIHGLEALQETLTRTVYAHGEERHRATTADAAEVALEPLLQAACAALHWSTPYATASLANLLNAGPVDELPEGVEGELLLAVQTELGWVLVGGEGPNVYDLEAAYILDLGGDDRYAAQATRTSAATPLNLVVDRAGNDVYGTEGEPGVAAARCGVSVLVDWAGNDTYVAGRHGLGAAALGVGVLADLAGDDRYQGEAFALGSALFGVGLCLDRAGDDRMEAPLCSLGFGGPGAVGILLDGSGSDERLANGVFPSTYGTEGEFHACSMGAGLGLRMLDLELPQRAGGWGLLLDGGGDDVSEVGEFGFGMGYFFGVGIVRDLEGDDVVRANRYGAATGAHFGIGVVLDDAGDDRWEAPHTAGLAGNWDLTLSFLADRAGDDHYVGGGICLGGSTITSLAGFEDAAGVDTYERGGGVAFGRAGHPSDLGRGAASLAVFLDTGGTADVYPAGPIEGIADDTTLQHRREETSGERTGVSGVGLFVDR